MAVSINSIGAGGDSGSHVVESGEVFVVASDQRIELPDVAAADAVLATTEGDLLAVTVDGDTIYLEGLISHIENETGAEIVFSDGGGIATLGDLLARAGGEMADLIDADNDVGGLFDLGSQLAALPAATQSTLSTHDILEEVKGKPAGLMDGLGEPDGDTDSDPGDGVWAGTEAVGTAIAMAMPSPLGDDSDAIDTVVGGIDDIV
jgi:hypothetical protein